MNLTYKGLDIPHKKITPDGYHLWYHKGEGILILRKGAMNWRIAESDQDWLSMPTDSVAKKLEGMYEKIQMLGE